MIFENAILFLRDGLISRELTDAVKKGDSGRVVLVLKAMALGFRGNGRSKYAYKMLHLIHNITRVWPPKITDIVLQNWLLNPTGRDHGFVEVDLVQEHMNYWIKVFYKAHGSNSSWEWLETISPCVNALRHLATAMKKVLGTDIGTRHSTVDLSTDISTLMRSLEEHDIYVNVAGRKLDEDDKPVIDIISVGATQLVDGPFLDEYNTTFQRLQQRRRITPLVGGKPHYDVPGPPLGWRPPSESDCPRPSSPKAGSVSGATEEGEGVMTATPGEGLRAPGGGCMDDGPSESAQDETENEAGTEVFEETEPDLNAALDEDEATLGLDGIEDVALEMDEEEVDEEEDDSEEMEEDAREISLMDVLQTAGVI